MDLKDYTREKLEKSAAEAKSFWDGVKSRLSNELLSDDDQLQIIDIQELSDDCIDLIMLRKSKEIDIEQLEHCRITVESRWFRKPKIRMHFSSGPFSNEFFDQK